MGFLHVKTKELTLYINQVKENTYHPTHFTKPDPDRQRYYCDCSFLPAVSVQISPKLRKTGSLAFYAVPARKL